MRVLRATMGEVRERLVRLEEGQARLEEDVARILKFCWKRGSLGN